MADRDDEDELERPEDQIYRDSGNVEGEDNIDPLPEDNDTPASDPTDPINDPTEDIDIRPQTDTLNPQHPITDTNIQAGEEYDEGLAGAAEAQDDPNAGNSVVAYDPDHDERRHPEQHAE